MGSAEKSLAGRSRTGAFGSRRFFVVRGQGRCSWEESTFRGGRRLGAVGERETSTKAVKTFGPGGDGRGEDGCRGVGPSPVGVEEPVVEGSRWCWATSVWGARNLPTLQGEMLARKSDTLNSPGGFTSVFSANTSSERG